MLWGQTKPKLWRKFRDVGMRCCDPPNFEHKLDFETTTYSLLVDGFIFLSFHWGSFVCYVNSGAHAPPQNTCWPKVDKFCRSEAICLHLVETDTLHCLSYLAGTDLIKLSWCPSFVKKVFGMIGRAWWTSSESSFGSVGHWSAVDFLVLIVHLLCSSVCQLVWVCPEHDRSQMTHTAECWR